MATKPTTKSTSTRKKTTKRGPTKATALKVLGLTQEDLEALKALKDVQEKIAQAEAEDAVGNLQTTADELQAHIDRANAEAEVTLTHVKSDPSVPQKSEGAWYVRNLRNTELGFRLERQQGTGKKRFDLKPRGQRGDLKKLEPKDLEDEVLVNQINYGVVEIITADEAREILSKQSTNAQQAPHPAYAALRNELGKEYKEGAIRVEPEFNEQGITVAHIDPAVAQGRLTDRELKLGAGLERAQPGEAPQPQTNRMIGGNPHIISDGFERNDTAAQADAIARRKGLEGPGAAGITTVVVTPTEKG